ncbi:MAG: DNA polymerase III subunit alpha [Selenomonadaceae bacterium]|nr:DNA polymerase III subunit alpha [Selenomonadaceae bacterium]
MTEKNFVHLHSHTEYSLLDGASRITDVLDQTKNLGMNALAITDHGNMYGVIDFYKAALERGVKPIIGCEVYVAPTSRKFRAEVNGEKYFHLILLAENNTGYKNLVKLVSAAATEGFYYKPRVDKELLREYHEGLIALSACVIGEIPRAILANDFPRALELAKEYAEIFGRENFFLEVQNHGLDEEKTVRDALIKISRELNLGLVATNDCHYVRREDSEFQDLLLCIQLNKTVDDTKRLRFPSDDYFLKSPAEMRALFEDIPEACDNTLKIAERCNVSFEFGKLQLPEFPLPKKFSSDDEYLRKLCWEKLSDRYALFTDEILTRLNYELDVIQKMGYAGYFLIVWNFIDFAKKKGIAVGPGRGSAAGSIVAYILGITELDPLEFNLLFERFLNPERVTMPDIDIDFCYIRREEVIEYVKNFYGADHVAQIVTFGTMAAKAAIRDVVRALNVPYAEGSRIVAMIPNELKITLDRALQTSRDFKNEYENNPASKRVIDFARRLEGLPRHASTHAAGIVISKLPLTDHVPVQLSNGMLVTQYDKDKIEELGLLKMDFLGLRTLTIINETIENIKKIRGVKVDIGKIPLRDRLTAQMLSDGDTGAVFQMESAGMTKLVKDLKPEGFADLIPTVALYRPGPLGSGMVEDFIAGRHGLKKPQYLHPKLEPILRETFGVILYQEQVMQIVQALAGFTLGQADLLRRAMGKKKAEILLAQRENFLAGCEANGVEKSLAVRIFELLMHFADYGFNKSHSAAYALIAWQTAYLKAHFPAEFMAAMLSSVMDSDRVGGYVELARNMGIEILPPDINSSGVHFEVEGGAIRFALSAIKNLGEESMAGVVEVRERGGNFTSLVDFCQRIDWKNFNKRALENLIKSGAFDSIDSRRTALLASVDSAITAGTARQKEIASGQINLFGEMEIPSAVPEIPEAPRIEILNGEKDALGFYMSGHPLDEFASKLSGLIQIEKVKRGDFQNGKRVKVGGIVTSLRQVTTKTGGMMAFLVLEDFTASVRVTVFAQIFNKCADFLRVDEVLVINGRVDISNDRVQILADNIFSARDYVPEIYLTVPPEIPLATLRKILEKNPGTGVVHVQVSGKWKHHDLKISDSEKFIGELRKFLGAENVRVC